MDHVAGGRGRVTAEGSVQKNGESVMEVLCTKYLDARPLFKASLDTYPDRPPQLIPMDITNDTGVEVAG